MIPASTAGTEATSAPGHKLFASWDVALATFLGSVLAGSIVLAINYRRLGRGRAAIFTLMAGAIVMAVLMAVAWLLPDSVPRFLYTAANIGLMLGMKTMAEALQGEALSAHAQAGGRVGAGWASAGIAVACLAFILGVVFAVVIVQSSMELGESVEVGKITVFFKDGVSEDEATKVGERFRAQAEAEHEADIQVRRRDGVPHIVFIVEKGTSTDGFRELGRDIADHAFGGVPVVIDLADPELEVHTSIAADPP